MGLRRRRPEIFIGCDIAVLAFCRRSRRSRSEGGRRHWSGRPRTRDTQQQACRIFASAGPNRYLSFVAPLNIAIIHAICACRRPRPALQVRHELASNRTCFDLLRNHYIRSAIVVWGQYHFIIRDLERKLSMMPSRDRRNFHDRIDHFLPEVLYTLTFVVEGTPETQRFGRSVQLVPRNEKTRALLLCIRNPVVSHAKHLESFPVVSEVLFLAMVFFQDVGSAIINFRQNRLRGSSNSLGRAFVISRFAECPRVNLLNKRTVPTRGAGQRPTARRRVGIMLRRRWRLNALTLASDLTQNPRTLLRRARAGDTITVQMPVADAEGVDRTGSVDDEAHRKDSEEEVHFQRISSRSMHKRRERRRHLKILLVGG